MGIKIAGNKKGLEELGEGFEVGLITLLAAGCEMYVDVPCVKGVLAFVTCDGNCDLFNWSVES